MSDLQLPRCPTHKVLLRSIPCPDRKPDQVIGCLVYHAECPLCADEAKQSKPTEDTA